MYYTIKISVLPREIIFVQLFFDNFIFHTHKRFLSPLFIFLSFVFLQIRRDKKKVIDYVKLIQDKSE